MQTEAAEKTTGRTYRNVFVLSMIGVVVAVLIIFLSITPPLATPVQPDLPKVSNAVSVKQALRRDAMQISIWRDGRIFFGSEQVGLKDIPALIRMNLESGAERKVYIKADANAEYGKVAQVAEAVRAAGIQNIVFLTDKSAASAAPEKGRPPK